MNGRRARKLRKKAYALTVGQPYATYLTGMDGSSLLAPTCTKGVYRKLKKEYMERKHAGRTG